MLRSFFRTAFRTIRRSPSYAIINVSGLGLGLTCALLIYSLISYHLSFDDFHQESGRIFRIVTEQHRDQVSYVSSVPPAFARAFDADYSYAEKVARLVTRDEDLVTVPGDGDDKKFEETVAFVDPEFFEIFNFPFEGNAGPALLDDLNVAIITSRMAEKYFGDQNPINKTIRIENEIDVRIVGIMKDIPYNTRFRSGIYVSYASLKNINEWLTKEDAWGGITTDLEAYARLTPGANTSAIEDQVGAYVGKFRAGSKNVHHYKFQPLADVHYNPDYGGVMTMTSIWTLGVVGLFLIITACVNFINLATAQATGRATEVGVRKSLGSLKGQLFWQFVIETSVIVGIAAAVSYVLAYALLPILNEQFRIHASLDLTSEWQLPLFFVLICIVVTFLSSSYPGLALSRFNPAMALKGKASGSSGPGFNIRRMLITTQFVISQLLLLALIVVFHQVRHMRTTDMGFNQDAIVMLRIGSGDEKQTTLKNELLRIPGVVNATACFSPPASYSNWGTSVRYDNRSEDEAFAAHFRGGDENYVPTFDIDLIAGRNVVASDTAREFLVNETFVTKLGIENPEDILGHTLTLNGGNWSGPVVGVMADFADGSVKAATNAIYLTTSRGDYNEYGVKISPNGIQETLRAMEEKWSATYPDQIYKHAFLNEVTADFFDEENRVLTLVQIFAFITLFIGCMGLYGLVTFMATRRTKEIGIRKVLGGSVSHIIWLFGKEFLILVLIGFAIAAPAGWWLLNSWLQRYETKIEMSAWLLAIEVAIISLMVIITVGVKTLRAASANPATALRTE